jgi:hypothetical protein
MIGSMGRAEWRWAVWATLALVIASCVPYLVAWALTPQAAHFTGILFNPQDGNSYLAKMREGFRGSWLFRLPYTPEPQRGAPVYLFYLLLGHIARATGLPLILVYHAARVLGGAAMLTALYALAAHLSDDVSERRAMFLLAALGSGLGWLVSSRVLTADLWVPEAFPVYALLANAHFPWAIALMAGVACCALQVANGEWRLENGGQEARGREWAWGLGIVVLAVVLGAVQPFGLLPVFGGLGVMLAAQAVRERRVPWRTIAWVAGAAVAALPYPLYMQWALSHDPVLAVWNAQNATPSPPPWDWALSYGLVLVLAVLGSVAAARRASGGWLLLGWAAVTLAGMYLPLPLQRRLSLGLGAPLGLLAGLGWWQLVRPHVRPRLHGLAQGLTVIACALTPVFIVSLTLLAALAGEPRFYLNDGEWAALTWLRDQGRADAVVLCSPRLGLFVPAWAGQPVVYGHPFETVDAERRERQVEAFFAGEMSVDGQQTFLRENHVGYVIGDLEIGDWRLMFESGDIRVYEIQSQ